MSIYSVKKIGEFQLLMLCASIIKKKHTQKLRCTHNVLIYFNPYIKKIFVKSQQQIYTSTSLYYIEMVCDEVNCYDYGIVACDKNK